MITKAIRILPLLLLMAATPCWAQAKLTVTLSSGSVQTYSIATSGGIYFSNDTMKIAPSASATTTDIALSAIRNIAFSNTSAIEESVLNAECIYPNPATTGIALQGIGDAPQPIVIYSMEGREVLRTTARDHETVDIHTLPQGIYLLRTPQQTHKLIKL